MILDCKPVFAGVESRLPFSYQLSLNELDAFSDWEPVAPCSVEGAVTNEAGIVSVTVSVRFALSLCCDRCAEPFEREFSFEGDSILVMKQNSEEDDYIEIPDAQFDADDFAESVILLNMPTKILCQEDCKGVCPDCGANLNRQTCSCSSAHVDPRMEKLRELLK